MDKDEKAWMGLANNYGYLLLIKKDNGDRFIELENHNGLFRREISHELYDMLEKELGRDIPEGACPEQDRMWKIIKYVSDSWQP